MFSRIQELEEATAEKNKTEPKFGTEAPQNTKPGNEVVNSCSCACSAVSKTLTSRKCDTKHENNYESKVFNAMWHHLTCTRTKQTSKAAN